MDSELKTDVGNALAHFQHAKDGAQGALAQFFVQSDFRCAIPHAKVELFHRVELHVRAFAARAPALTGSRNELFLRAGLFHLMEDAAFGGDDELGCRLCWA